MKRHQLLAAVFGVVALVMTANAADWPGWRGPGRDGISKETGLLKEWPKEGPKLVWQVKAIGLGYSTPAVVGDRIYLVSNKGTDNEYVQALDAKDGKQVWATTIGKVGPNQGPQYPGARSTPTVDGDHLYALGSNGDLACLEIGGKVVWNKNLRKEFGGKPGAWAYAESPLIDGDTLVCTPGGSEAALVALNKKSGEVIWKTPLAGSDTAGYASVMPVEAAGTKLYVQFMGKGLVGVDAKTGKFQWRYEKTGKSPANMPTPVVGGDMIYSASRSGGGAVKIKAEKDGVIAGQVYFDTNLPNNIGGSVLVNGYLYGTSGALQCVEFVSGTQKWKDKCIGASSICSADGMLYLHGEDGRVALVEATPEAYREKGRFTPPNQPDRGKSKAWTYPVVANGRLYIHDWGTLWCYDVKARK